MKLINNSGKIYYGLHMYPGVAQYKEPGRDLMVFINEDTIRKMDPTFAGKPVYVMHVDGVEQSIDKLRNEADGWVIESFFNEADGKHWAKFIICSSLGMRAIENQGMRLSNCYIQKGMGPEGRWNGVSYDAQIMNGEYEHLALVPNPRYEESVIMTPDEFKIYNERQRDELKRLSNNDGDRRMKFKIFNRKEVKESELNLADTFITLKSGREVSILALVNETDEKEDKGKAHMANEEHHVQVGEEKMSVGDLKKKYQDMCNELTEMKAKHVGNGDDDEEARKKALEVAEHEKKEIEAKKNALETEIARLKNEADARKTADAAKAARDKAEADKLRNAGPTDQKPSITIELPMDKIKRGIERYG